MEFSQAWRELDELFRAQVSKDAEECGWESIYLPNVEPAGPVDFVLIGTEPSHGKKGHGPNSRNFAGCWQCLPLHYSIDEFLCVGTGNYYLTDLAKGAMLVGSNGTKESGKFERWYPLLLQELELVAKPEAKIIGFGKDVDGFLRKQKLPGYVGSVTHYSKNALSHWGIDSILDPDGFQQFRESVLSLAKKDLTETDHKLMFHYRRRLTELRSEVSEFGEHQPSLARWGNLTGAGQPLRSKGCGCSG